MAKASKNSAKHQAQDDGRRTQKDLITNGRIAYALADRRAQEKREHGDAELRRRIVKSLGQLHPAHFQKVAHAIDGVGTDSLMEAVDELSNEIQDELGFDRWAEVLVAVLHRFDHNVGRPDVDEQLAEDLVELVKSWAYGTSEQPAVTADGTVIARVGMRASAIPNSDAPEQAEGPIVAMCKDGALVRDEETGLLIGCEWRLVELLVTCPGGETHDEAQVCNQETAGAELVAAG